MKELYRGVESRIAGNELIAKRYPVQIEAALRQQGLHDGFLDRINASRIGTFHGTGEGAKQLDGIAKGVDFSDKNSTLKVLGQLVEALETNMQERTKAPLSVDSQVKGGQTEELYDYLFQLEYLQPVFQLTLDGRRLNELTPGEKGYMLIVFYLFLDRENIPLVIDQPEENLDNQSVFELMLPCLRDAKQRRQLIVVTHNPNLAVVCDADQVIRARINKTRGYAVTYSGGSIESPDTNADIVQVLEGTLPAFDNRDTKYDVTRSHQPRTTEAG